MGPKRIICAVAVVAGALATASPAMAAPNTYCVGKPSCSGIVVGTLQSALDQAKAHAGSDTVELGAGDFTTASSYTYLGSILNPVTIKGEGAGQTRLLTTQSGTVTTLTLRRGVISDLEVVGPPSPGIADFAVALDLTGLGERLKLTGGWVNVILGAGANLRQSTLTGGGLDYSRPAVIVSAGEASLSDSTVDATSVAVRVKDLGVMRLLRSTIASPYGVWVTDGGGAEIRDSLIRGKGTSLSGIVASATTASAGVYATNVTVVGTGDAGGAGVVSTSNGDGKNANVELRNSVITRAAAPLRRNAFKGYAYIKVSNSAYDPTTVISEGEGAFDSSVGNTAAAPGFVDAPGNDFHLAPGSALVDAGDPAPDGGLGDLDLDGKPRTVDGDGDGSAAPDIGAFELQRPAGPADPVTPAGPDTPPADVPPADDTPAADLRSPIVSSLSLTHRRFRVGRAATARSASARPRGTAFRFTLSKDARVTIAISRRVNRARRAAGKLARAGHAGRNRVAFTGRVGRRALKPGRYVAKVSAVDAGGRKSEPRRIRFRIVRA